MWNLETSIDAWLKFYHHWSFLFVNQWDLLKLPILKISDKYGMMKKKKKKKKVSKIFAIYIFKSCKIFNFSFAPEQNTEWIRYYKRKYRSEYENRSIYFYKYSIPKYLPFKIRYSSVEPTYKVQPIKPMGNFLEKMHKIFLSINYSIFRSFHAPI